MTMSATLVFPSNAQPDRYANTAALFQTDLEETLALEGEWEVALQDMSYINTMPSLANETLLLGRTDTEEDVLEKENKVVTYNFNTSISEWSDDMFVKKPRPKRNPTEAQIGRQMYSLWKLMSTHHDKVRTRNPTLTPTQRKAKARMNQPVMATNPEVRSYNNKLERFLHIMNKLAPHVWRWRYDGQRKRIRLMMKSVEDAGYAFHVTDGLKDVLCLKSNLYIPSTYFPYGDGAKATLFLPGTNITISNEMEHIDHWESRGLAVTLLPLHRMRKIDTPLDMARIKSWKQLVEAMNKTTMIYGLKITYDDKLSKIVFHMAGFRASLVHFNESLRALFNIKADVLWRYDLEIMVPINASFNSPGCGFRIYTQTLIPMTHQSLSWKLGQEVKLSNQYFNLAQDLCALLNSGDKTKYIYEFNYNDADHKFDVSVHGSTVLFLSSNLAKTMGFTKQRFYQERTIATRPSLFPTYPNHFYVYANFIRPTQVGGKPVPLLKYIPIESGAYGSTLHKEFLNKTYVPVNVSRLRHCEFGMYDDTGKLINFKGGRTVLTLHFRKTST